MLEQHERWFWSGVRSSTPPSDVDRVVRATGGLSPLRRLGIYRSAYFTRQLVALEETFPRTRALIGAEHFRKLGLAYLTARPSEAPAIERVGEALADYLCGLRDGERPEPAVVEVCRLEQARLAVLLSPEPPQPCTLEALSAFVAEERLPRLDPSLRVVWLSERAFELCGRSGAGGVAPAGLAVRRRGFAVVEHELAPDEARGLELVASGGGLDELMTCLADPEGTSAVARALASWFRRGWFVASVFAALALCLTGCSASDEAEQGYGFATGPTMRAGDDCLRCHSAGSDYPEAPHFSAAGTVFPAVDSAASAGVQGVSVELLSPEGELVERLTTNSVGNFYTRTELPRGFRVVIEQAGARLEMPCPPPAGNCGACHSLPPIGEAQGRIYAPGGGTLAEPPLDCKTWTRPGG